MKNKIPVAQLPNRKSLLCFLWVCLFQVRSRTYQAASGASNIDWSQIMGTVTLTSAVIYVHKYLSHLPQVSKQLQHISNLDTWIHWCALSTKWNPTRFMRLIIKSTFVFKTYKKRTVKPYKNNSKNGTFYVSTFCVY